MTLFGIGPETRQTVYCSLTQHMYVHSIARQFFRWMGTLHHRQSLSNSFTLSNNHSSRILSYLFWLSFRE
ncbi:uncharacterized protein STEHIDRAFT_119148 [Stereum hirsutum FP-91666 SS1]|uniref:uncharacterized protein n=1 Tax=Stereum hirsutum (strain FP-91666) TaxID=721885 RepID=UPI000440C4D1|nr:uncharacterized protein STEHIDRAFT_119148 [Stereum hirsutum FP-91666 SS1]EIM90093.1 hypothetical protein STEHIDRAFT_119148 [Stereum hirsutum FP-91666 SS1]